MQIFKKEKQVVELALKHADKTDECLEILSSAVRAYAAGDASSIEPSMHRVTELETRADELVREIRELLYSGAYLPTIRGDVHRLLTATDKIANRAEDCLEFVNLQRPQNIDGHADGLRDLLDSTTACFEQFHLALRAFFKPKGMVEDVRDKVRQVGVLESKIDEDERALLKSIFDSNLDLAGKQHLARLVTRIVRISDQIENAADVLELLSLKSII
ncbi:MAG: DUF47 family protein [Woeseiaceae bacterium]|nr:DUF47 family protein [Woeseiaceae bacterium]